MTQTSISSKLDNKEIFNNKNKNNTTNTDDNHSCVIPKKKYSYQATYTTPHLTPLKTTLTIEPVELHKTKQLSLDGKEYLCLQINSKSPHAAQCAK